MSKTFRLTKFRNMLVIFAVALAATPYMFGDAITGTANVGNATLGFNGASIDFFGGLPNCTTSGFGIPGCFTVQNGTGSFVAGSNASVQDLLNVSGGAVSIPGWGVFSNGITIDLTNIFASFAPACSTLTAMQRTAVNTTCSIGIVTLTNTPTGVSFAFGLGGVGFTGTSATGTTPVTAIFTTQFTGTNIDSLFGTIASGGEITHNYSGTISTTSSTAVPEPSSLLLLGSGTLGLIGVLRRKLRA